MFHDISKPLVLIVARIRPPIPVEEIAVLIYLVLIGTLLSGSPIRGPYRDGEIEGGRLEDALLADQRDQVTFETESGQIDPRHWLLPMIGKLIHIRQSGMPYQRLAIHVPNRTQPNSTEVAHSHAASSRTALAIVSAASRCIPGITCEYRCRVNSGEA